MGFETIRPGVTLETREHGPPGAAAPALVVWGHGLCNSLDGEDQERLWDFWNPRARPSGVVAATPDAHTSDRAPRVVRYAARGHGASSPGSDPAECAWPALGDDMLELARALRRDASQRLVLGGASMGSASALFASLRANRERSARRAASETLDEEDEISGLVLVILPTFHETRARRSGRIAAAVDRGFSAFAERGKKMRPIFEGTDREREAPPAVGVRADSFEAVMRGSAASDLPAAETIAEAVGDVPTLALCWDCGDATHPESSARAFAAAAKGARVHVAKTLEEVEKWPGMINAFVDEIVGKRGAGGNE